MAQANPGCAAAAKDNTKAKTSDSDALDAILEVPLVGFMSADGESHTVEKKIARKLNFDDATVERAMTDDEPIILEDIESDIFDIMIKWAEIHVDDEDAEDSDDEDDDGVKRTDNIDERDNTLLDKASIPTLFRLLKVSINREIKSLSKVLAKKTASKFKNKTVEQLRETITSLRTAEKKR